MSVFRRHLMMAFPLAQSKDYSYIEDGLVFHLDGIDKGPNEGKWTDLVRGVVFDPVSQPQFYSDSVKGSFNTNSPIYWNSLKSTIEVCVRTANNDLGQVWFISNINDGIALGYSRTYKGFMCNTNVNSNFAYKAEIEKDKIYFISVNNNNSLIVNGEKIAINRYVNSWAKPGKNNIDGLNSCGKIYSIRIYNRLLTEEEMRHNQEVDYERFDLANAIHNDAISQISSLEEVNSPQNIVFPSTTYHTLTDEEIALAASKGWSVVSA